MLTKGKRRCYGLLHLECDEATLNPTTWRCKLCDAHTSTKEKAQENSAATRLAQNLQIWRRLRNAADTAGNCRCGRLFGFCCCNNQQP